MTTEQALREALTLCMEQIKPCASANCWEVGHVECPYGLARAALALPETPVRVEYRNSNEFSFMTGSHHSFTKSLEECEEWLAEIRDRDEIRGRSASINPRIETRTISESPWVPVEGEKAE